MKNTKVKSKLLCGICIVAIIALCALANLNFLQPAYAIETDSNIANLTEQQYTITNTDEPNGVEIENYATDKYGKKAVLTWDGSKKIRIIGNDDIIKIVPEELFKQVGTVQHIGKEYGFFIETKKPFVYNDMFLSTVIIIDVTNTDNMYSTESMSHLKIRLTPIFQADFAYIERGNNKIYSLGEQKYNFFNDKYQKDLEVEYPLEGNSFVIPIPTLYNLPSWPKIDFLQHNKYYLTNASNETSLYNTNQLNPSDQGYNATQDNGCFFSQLDFSYDGFFLEKGKTNAEDVGSVILNAASLSFDLYDKAKGLKSVFKAAPVLGQVITVADTINTIVNISNDLKYQEISDAKMITYTPYYNNKDQQIANGGLRKDANIAVMSNAEKQLLFGTNDYFEFDYQIHCQDITVDTRYATLINVGIMSVVNPHANFTQFGTIYESTSVYSNELFNHTDKDYKEIPKIEIGGLPAETSIQILPNSKSYLQLLPIFSGNHSINLNSTYSKFSIYEVSRLSNGILNYKDTLNKICDSQKIDDVAKSGEIYLDKNKNYLLVADLDDNISGRYGVIQLDTNLVKNNVEIGNNSLVVNYSSEYLKFESTMNVNYKFFLNNHNATIHLLDENFLEINSSINGEMFVTLDKAKTYYLRLDKQGTITENINLIIIDQMNVYFENIDNINNPITSNIIVTKNTIINLPSPEKNGYVFDGWWAKVSLIDQKISNENIFDFIQPTLSLKAKWIPIEYTVFYEENGGNEIENGKYIIEHVVVLNQNIVKPNFVFCGWYEDPLFSGDEVKSFDVGNIGNKTFYAKWVQEKFHIMFDLNSDLTDDFVAEFDDLYDIVDNKMEVRYKNPFTLPTPSLIGFEFDGWLYEGNVLLFTDSFDFETDIELVAKWNRKNFYIKIGFAKGNGVLEYKWLKSNGDDLTLDNDNDSSLSFNIVSPNNYVAQLKLDGFTNKDNAFLGSLFKVGQKFVSFVHDASIATPKVFDWTNLTQAEIENGNTIILEAFYAPEKEFKIYIENVEGAEGIQGNLAPKKYLEAIDYKTHPTKVGHTFSHYVVSDNIHNLIFSGDLAIGKTFSYTNMPDLSQDREMDGEIIYLKPVFTPNNYEATLYFENSIYDIKNVLYGNAYNSSNNNAFPIPNKEGYNFLGWFSGENGSGKKIVDEFGCINKWDIADNVNLFANMQPKEYVISFDKQGGVGGVDNAMTTYDNYVQLFMNSSSKITNSNEFLQYMDIAPIIDKYGLVQYIISFEIKAAVQGEVLMYLQNGVSAKYYFESKLKVETEFKRHYIAVTPINYNLTLNEAWLAFYGTYGTGRIITVKDMKIEVGSNQSYFSTNQITPQKTGYVFQGYYSLPDGGGIKYYDANMVALEQWKTLNNETLYAYWTPRAYTLSFDYGQDRIIAYYGEVINLPYATKTGYKGIWTLNGNDVDNLNYTITGNADFKIRFKANENTMYLTYKSEDQSLVQHVFSREETYDKEYSVVANSIEGYTFDHWEKTIYRRDLKFYENKNYSTSVKITYKNACTENGEYYRYGTASFIAIYTKNCVAEGSLITLADGTQKAVEELTGGEQLLVWNLFTGTFDTAPILFIDSDAESVYEVINLGFSDGTSVKVISEHAFWDFDLNKYVFLRRDAAQYIGHWFNKQTTDAGGNMTWTRVQLMSVDVQNEVTTAWSPVTYGHLCYYVNGMLSMPGATEGLINIFDVNPDTMKIDETAYNADIAEYGLFTYAEFAETVPVPEEIFDAFGGQYFKVAIGKGILTWDMIANLVERYAVFF